MVIRRSCCTPGCARTPPRRSAICGVCWRALPVETRLAFGGHEDAGRNPDGWGIPKAERAEWFRFLRWSWFRTMDLAALQAWARRGTAAPAGELQALAEGVGIELWDVRQDAGHFDG